MKTYTQTIYRARCNYCMEIHEGLTEEEAWRAAENCDCFEDGCAPNVELLEPIEEEVEPDPDDRSDDE